MITGYNAVATVREAVASVLAQEFVSLEVVYVDDGSSDGSADALSALATNGL